MKTFILLTSALVAAVPGCALAAAGDIVIADQVRNDVITVVATGNRIPVSETGQSVSIVGLPELERIQGPDLTRVLERLPGVSLARSGPLGAQTGLFVRGANSDQVLVMVDGVRVADYASPGGNYDLGNLLSGNLQSLELLRGANSVVWGSRAMGGVLAVTTRELNGAEGSAEYGAFNTVSANAAAGLRTDGHAFDLSAGYVHSDGFSAKTGSTEADGIRQWQLGGKGRVELGSGLTLRAVGRYANARLGVDLASPSAPDIQFVKQGSGRAALDYAATGFTLSTGLSFDATARRYDSPDWGPSEYIGSAVRADLVGHVDLPRDFGLDFGADSEWSRARSSFDPHQSSRLSSAHVLLGWHPGGAALAAGLRVDDHDRFGSHVTFGANASVAVFDGWRLRAAYGEGFKAPTLYQLYAGFGTGNLDLRPETTRSYEAGIEKGDRNGPLHLAATWFRRDSSNLIDVDSNFHYINVGSARAEGAEVELGARLSDRFSASATYTLLRARDLGAGRDLARRPHHTVALAADWETPLHALALGADLRFVSDAVDYDFLGTPLPIDSHAVVTLRASLPVGENFQVFARLENLTDEHYATVSGYKSPGRSAYAGVRLRI